eukprot:sb/3462069/
MTIYGSTCYTVSLITLFCVKSAGKLCVLTMFDTPVSIIKHYRHHAVNTIWSLKCLDQLIVSDEEVIEDARFQGHYSAYNPSLRIGSLPYITKTLPESEAKLQCLRTLKLVEGILRKHSPVVIIQRAWKGRMKRRRQSEINELQHWAAVCIQRYWRIKHGIPQPLPDAFSPLTGSVVESPVRTAATEQPPKTQEKVPFRISSAKLLANIKTKTSFTKIWGAVPFMAGLEGNVFEKRSGKVQEALTAAEETRIKTPPEGLELVAEKTSLQEPQQFRDIVTSCREAGRVVREAAKHYRDVQKYRPPTVREAKKAPTSNSQCLFLKIQDSMALSCLRAVQQAYKNRAQVEANAARQDRVLLQRHQHKVTLARVDAIKNATRIEALHKRELDDTRIRESIYKQHDAERREVLALVKKREERKREAKDRKQYKQFMIDFSCQNASLSKALARHDRRAIRDDNTAASQEQVLLLRDQNTRSQRSVKEYQEFVRLRRQAESQYDKAQMNTILIEEQKRREMDVRDRIDYLKSLKDPPPIRLLLQRHQHKVTLARVDAIKNATRIEALHKRELDDTRIRESIYKQHDAERREVLALVKKREERKREAKDRKQYKQFMIDFSCQNASLSKALARHDRRAIRDDNTAASQEQVLLLRDQNTRSQRSVKEYQEFVRLRRQAESQYDKAQMNTILIEEQKRREMDVRDRIDYLKSLKENPSPPPSVNVKKVSADATTNEIVGDYRRTFGGGAATVGGEKQQDFLLGRKCVTSSSESIIRPPPPPKHLAAIRFDLTIPKPTDFELSKTNTTESLPAPRLNKLMLNEFPNFPSTPALPRHERDGTRGFVSEIS